MLYINKLKSYFSNMRFSCSSLPVIKSYVLNMRGIQYNLWYLIWPVIMLDRS